MQAVPVSVSAPAVLPRLPQRSVLLVSADASFRQRLLAILMGLRWQVREAASGSEAWAEAEIMPPGAAIVDSWLPDLDLKEFLVEFRRQFPMADMVTTGGSDRQSPRGPYRQELLYALRSCQETDTAAWNTATVSDAHISENAISKPSTFSAGLPTLPQSVPTVSEFVAPPAAHKATAPTCERLPEMIGTAPCMIEVSRRIRLVAPRTTPVLIEGPTGSGKELVAEALHRLSPRHRKPLVAINCAAIPEALLEAELFGHTRGAFTGAVQGRVGRIEAADGGTLFLDEIGEMPLGLQSKLLRFVECGELQRVGDNETVKVDVRIIAATHRPLAQRAADGEFRSDLYYRLAVFLVRTPALAEHIEDLPQLVDHFLGQMGREAPVKHTDASALQKLTTHSWPGNVRELAHVLERAVILAGDEPVLTAREIDFGLAIN
ncbi:MAG: sigma-54 dependent transcriptional regulator [Terracidiphilus sp.]|nr:sigma-54 dependent transcriptional regulator [Terracidiphilus sp.]